MNIYMHTLVQNADNLSKQQIIKTKIYFKYKAESQLPLPGSS